MNKFSSRDAAIAHFSTDLHKFYYRSKSLLEGRIRSNMYWSKDVSEDQHMKD